MRWQLGGATGMFTRVTDDLSAALVGVVDGAASPTLLVMAAVVVYKGIRTNGLMGVFGRAAAALLLMLAALYLVYGVLAPERFSIAHWAAHTERSWNALMLTTGQTMAGYYLAALAGVALVFAVKSLLHRHD